MNHCLSPMFLFHSAIPPAHENRNCPNHAEMTGCRRNSGYDAVNKTQIRDPKKHSYYETGIDMPPRHADMKYCRLTGFMRCLVISYQLYWTIMH